MFTAATIEEFHALLSGQENGDSKLLSLLREFANAMSPDDIVKLSIEATVWTSWRSIEP